MYTEQVKQTAIKYYKCPYLGIRGLKIQSKLFPEGEKSFWGKERYSRITKIQNETLFLGQMWINSGCPDIVSMPNFIGVINNALTKSIDRLCSFNQSINTTHKMEIAQKELDTFWCIYLEYRAINAIIHERPEMKFRDYLTCEENLKTEIIEIIRKELKTKYVNVILAIIVCSLQEKRYIDRDKLNLFQFHKAANTEFGKCGSRTAFNTEFNNIKIYDMRKFEVEEFKNKLP